MANPELGAKQICPACSTKFYDLTRRPAVCPKCGNAFDPEEALRNRRVRVRAPLPDDDTEEVKPVAAESEDDGFEAEPDEAKEIDQVADEIVIADDDDENPASPDDELGVDFAEDEDDLEEDTDDVPFLEDDDDDDDLGVIDGLPEEGADDN